jgi:26S proteasome regulatory subunit N2
VDVHWAEICGSLPTIESISEDTAHPARSLAAALASKCYYHLQVYNECLRFALAADSHINVSEHTEYIDVLLTTCIDEYKALRTKQELEQTAGAPSTVAIDPRMEAIVEQMFARCYTDHCYEQALGVALDTYRIDKVDEVCSQAIKHTNTHDILTYAFNLCANTHTRSIQSRRFRLAVIEVLVKQYSTLAHPDYTHMCFGLQALNQPVDVAILLRKLCVCSEEDFLQACQIAFDMQECENQGFVLKIVAVLQTFDATSAPVPTGTSSATGVASSSTLVPSIDPATLAPITDNALYTARMNQLKRILLESFDVDLYLNFLFKHNHSDISILQTIKSIISGGAVPAAGAAAVQPPANQHTNSVLHNATVVAHAFMYSGTTVDVFLRENLDWLGKASNWNKFTAVASIGVVHKGHIHESMNLLQPYLPQVGQSASPYSEAGALYALGMIHANKGGSGDSTTITYLTEALKNAGLNEVVQHGACLGIGLAAMATGDSDIFENLRQILFTDNAVAGEGAALAIGLLMLGQSDSALAEVEIPNLLNAAHDSPHEKIVRALSLSIAMFVYGKEESADVIIEQLLRDRDSIIRYGGVYAVGLAYIGTSDNNAIKKLLHVAVSDVSDDVRRASVACLGMVCFRNPETVPKLVNLLAESFNPHLRYGACMAVGIACAGTVGKEAIELLFPMIEDEVDFVRQGALVGLALVLQQASDARSPSVKKFRETCVQIIGDKYQSLLTKSGAILASGILDAGGRNVVFSLSSRAGFVKMGAAVGIMMFLQNWYWYPLLHCLSLSFAPTVLIGLNKDFDMPSAFGCICNTPASMFAYPKAEEKKDDGKKQVATAVLSTTAKAKLREARKEARKGVRTGGASSPRETPRDSARDSARDPLGPPASPSHAAMGKLIQMRGALLYDTCIIVPLVYFLTFCCPNFHMNRCAGCPWP